MARPGTMPTTSTAPVPGVDHFGSKLINAPKQRQNMLNIRVSPMKRMLAPVKPVKADTPSSTGNF